MNVFRFLICFCLITGSKCFAQNRNIDSIQALILKDKADTTKVNHLNALVREYVHQGLFHLAEQTGANALELAKKLRSNKAIAGCYNSIAIVHYYSGNYPQALENHFSSLKVKEELKDKKGIATSYNNIGAVYEAQNDYPEALKNYVSALTISKEIKDKRGTGNAHINIANIYDYMGNPQKALESYQEGLKTGKEIGNKDGIAEAYFNIGFVYRTQGNYEEALKNYLASLAIREEMDDKQSEAKIFIQLGLLNISLKKNKIAADYFDKALLFGRYSGSKQIIKETYKARSGLDSVLGDKTAQLRDYKLYISYRDSLNNEATKKQILKAQLTYEFEKKEMDLKVDQTKKDLIADRNKIVFIAVIIALISLVIILFLYIRQNKYKTQKQNLDIEQKLLQIQMNPHFIFNSLQAIQSFILTNKQNESLGYLSSFSRLMRLILENSKHEFISLDKEIDTLTYYLELQQLRFKNLFVYSISIDPAIDKEFIFMPPMLLQPFIENAIEHGFKGMKEKGILKFNVLKQNNQLILEVIDNGAGIEKTRESKRSGESKHISYALEIINKRIEILNQNLKTTIRLTITDLSSDSGQECGTKISLCIPNINKLK